MTDQLTQNSFLGDMQTVIRGQVESLTRYEIDGDNKGGSIWVSKPNTGKNPNNLGNELIKVKMPFEMFDQKKAEVEAGKLYFPCQMEILCEINMGGQNKAVLTAISMKLDGPEPGQIKDEDIDKTTGEILPGKDKPKTGAAQTTTGTTSANKP
ncbi:MAG: hypothetical protein WC504_01620 [Methylobacter sp.]